MQKKNAESDQLEGGLVSLYPGWLASLYLLCHKTKGHTWNNLKKFFRSPYLNGRYSLHPDKEDLLLETIEKLPQETFIKEFDCVPVFLRTEFWYKVLSPEKTYSDVSFRRQGSDIKETCELFVAMEFSRKDHDSNANRKIFEKILIMQALTDSFSQLRGHLISDNRLLGDIRRLMNRNQSLDVFHYKELYYNAEIEFNYLHFKSDRNSAAELKLRASDGGLVYFLTQQLGGWCQLLSEHWEPDPQDPRVIPVEEVMIFIEKNVPKKPALLSAYMFIYELLSTNKVIKLKDMTEYFSNKSLNSFTDKQARDIASHFVNHCVRQINMGLLEYHKILFGFYKVILAKELVFEKNGALAPAQYRNIVFLSIVTGNLGWGEKFVQTYKKSLPIKFRDSYYYNCRALISFEREQFDSVIRLTSKMDRSTDSLKYESYYLTIKAYYELGEDNALLSMLESFKTALYREEDIDKTRKKSYLNAINTIKSLEGALKGSKIVIKLSKKLDDDSYIIASKKWIKQKVAKLL